MAAQLVTREPCTVRVEDHSSSSSGLTGDFDTGTDHVQVGDGCAAGDEN